MLIEIYHGSEHIVQSPKFGYGKTFNDYGLGFYCTRDKDLAKEWGVGKNRNGYANHYEIECDGLTILDLNASNYCILHWFLFYCKTASLMFPQDLLWKQRNIFFELSM